MTGVAACLLHKAPKPSGTAFSHACAERLGSGSDRTPPGQLALELHLHNLAHAHSI
jgi:hypothetical protein